MDYKDLLNPVIKISNSAGNKILDIYNSSISIDVEYKKDTNISKKK